MEIRIAVPRVPSGLLANLLGVFGLVGFALAVGGLTGNFWWSLLVGCFFATGLSYIAQTQSAAQAQSAAVEGAADGPVRIVEVTQPIDELAREVAYMRGRQVPASA